jgi:hypothetical protein
MKAVKWTIVLGLAGVLAGPPVLAQEGGEEAPSDEESGITKELKDLGREIRKSMEEQGKYVGDRLGEWSEESGSWAADRALQARVKTTLAGVLGAGSIGTVNVDVTEGVVTLKGELADWDQVARAVGAVRQIEGVRQVVSRLRVPGGSV